MTHHSVVLIKVEVKHRQFCFDVDDEPRAAKDCAMVRSDEEWSGPAQYRIAERCSDSPDRRAGKIIHLRYVPPKRSDRFGLFGQAVEFRSAMGKTSDAQTGRFADHGECGTRQGLYCLSRLLER